MRSDVIHVNSDGTGIKDALAQAEAVAAYKKLEPKKAIHLRLLAEEMMGMLSAMTGNLDAEFWIEDKEREFELHLLTDTVMNNRLRKQLLSTATSGTNAASKGVMGKIRELFEKALEPVDEDMTGYYNSGWTYMGTEGANLGMTAGVWSFNQYRESLKTTQAPKENWDELEKSIIANLADEVKIWIKNGTVEMTVFKKI